MGVITVVGLLLLLLWYGSNVLLLVFAGLLLAVFLRSLSDWVSRHTPLSDGWALVLVVLGLVALIALAVSFFAPSVTTQAQQLAQGLPQAAQQARQYVTQLPFGQQVLAQAPQAPQAPQLVPQSTNVLGRVTGVFSTALGVLANIVIIVFVGIYVAADPGLYRRGLVRLVPQRKRARAQKVLDVLGYTLRWWLVGRFAIMVVNGTLTALALWWLGVPLPFLNG